jgi:hypothetical protein
MAFTSSKIAPANWRGLTDKICLTGEDIYNQSLVYACRTDQLRPGESEVFYGGWSNHAGGGGHANIYEVSRCEDNSGNYDVLLFTSTFYGATDTYITHNKEKLVPVVHYANVPAEVLLFKDRKTGEVHPAFISSLMELNVLAAKDPDTQVTSSDVRQIFSYLDSYQVPVALHEVGAITGQRAGSCVPSVTKTWIRKHTEHLGLYKQLIFRLKLMAIHASFQLLEETLRLDTPDGEMGRCLLIQLARQLLLRTNKRIQDAEPFGGPLISAELAHTANATALDLLYKIREFEEAIEELHCKCSAPSMLSKTDSIEQRRVRSGISQKVVTIPTEGLPSAAVLADFSIKINLENDCCASLLAALERTRMRCHELAQKSGKELNVQAAYLIQIHHLVDQLPLPSIAHGLKEMARLRDIKADFWDHFTAEQAAQVQKELFALVTAEYLWQEVYQHDLLTRRMATILPLQVLSHYLAIKIDGDKHRKLKAGSEALLESYPVSPLADCVKLEGLQFLDRHEFDRVQASYRYLQAFKGKKPLFESEGPSLVERSTVEKSPANGIYWKALLDADSELKKVATAIAAKEFPNLSDEAIQQHYRKMESAYNDYQSRLAQYEWQACAYNTEEAERARLLRAGKQLPPRNISIQASLPPRSVNHSEWLTCPRSSG